MREVKVWDPLVRTFHWGTVIIVFTNYFVIDEGGVHEFLGYILAALIGTRLLWGLVSTGYARFSNFFPTAEKLRLHLSQIKEGGATTEAGHNPIGAIMIFNLFATLSAVCVTGFMATTDRFWGVEWVEDTHELFAAWLMLSVLLHVGGVVLETMRSGINLIAAMFSGIKRMP